MPHLLCISQFKLQVLKCRALMRLVFPLLQRHGLASARTQVKQV